MKIALILISNRPDKMKRIMNSIHIMNSFKYELIICAAFQHPICVDDEFVKKIDRYVFIENKGQPTPFTWYRKQAMALADDCDYFWFLDDDHQFKDGKGALLNKTCVDYYDDVFDFLAENIDVGVFSCRGYFGGYGWGYDIKRMPKNALISTDAGGFIIKNIGIDKIIEPCEENVVGAFFELLASFNTMATGLKYAKRFNSPISFEPPGKTKHFGNSKNISYSDNVVSNGIQKIIREKFNDATFNVMSKKYPLKIASMFGVSQ